MGWSAFLGCCCSPLHITAYAKLNTGITTGHHFEGIVYSTDALRFDTCTLFVIFLELAVTFYARGWRRGVVLYLIYIVRVGDDFMSARFFRASLFLCVWL